MTYDKKSVYKPSFTERLIFESLNGKCQVSNGPENMLFAV